MKAYKMKQIKLYYSVSIEKVTQALYVKSVSKM